MSGTVEPKKISALTIIATLVLLGAFSGFAWLVYLQRQTIPTIDEQKREERLKTLTAVNSDNQKILTTYHWIDKSKQIVGIPIKRAMQLVVNDLAGNRPHPAGPINPPAASPSPSPAASPAAKQPSTSSSPAAPTASSPTPAASPSPAAPPVSSPAPAASPSPAASPASSPAPEASPSPRLESSPTPSPSPSPGVTGNERERARTNGNAVNDDKAQVLGPEFIIGSGDQTFLSRRAESMVARHAVPETLAMEHPSPRARCESLSLAHKLGASFSLVLARSTSHFLPLTSHLSPYVCS